ncbi:hypothetical protein D3C80_2073600 [compost metagenome]
MRASQSGALNWSRTLVCSRKLRVSSVCRFSRSSARNSARSRLEPENELTKAERSSCQRSDSVAR